MDKRFVPQYEVTFPYDETAQRAYELYERRRFTRFTTRRQHSAFMRRFVKTCVGCAEIGLCRPFMENSVEETTIRLKNLRTHTDDILCFCSFCTRNRTILLSACWQMDAHHQRTTYSALQQLDKNNDEQ